MKTVDLTMTLNNLTPVYPGDPKPEFKRIAFCEKEGWNEHRISINTHLGTHIDAPWHMIEDGKKLTDYPIDKFFGNAIIFDVRNQKTINIDLKGVKENDIILLRTDHTKNINKADFFSNNPVISKDLAKKIVRKKISIVGIDSYTPDNPPFEIHKYFFKHDVLSLENLVNLDLISIKTFKIFILPIKLERTDGAPCRVIAQID
ncbi:MAG: cyclase family protein [Spirochaetes bacterium]|nr:cyclase family protein [Spirochaetota bacterium]